MRQLRRNVSEVEKVYRGQSRLPQKQDIHHVRERGQRDIFPCQGSTVGQNCRVWQCSGVNFSSFHSCMDEATHGQFLILAAADQV